MGQSQFPLIVCFRFLRYLFLLQLFRVLRIDRHRGAFATFKAVVKNHFKASSIFDDFLISQNRAFLVPGRKCFMLYIGTLTSQVSLMSAGHRHRMSNSECLQAPLIQNLLICCCCYLHMFVHSYLFDKYSQAQCTFSEPCLTHRSGDVVVIVLFRMLL